MEKDQINDAVREYERMLYSAEAVNAAGGKANHKRAIRKYKKHERNLVIKQVISSIIPVLLVIGIIILLMLIFM